MDPEKADSGFPTPSLPEDQESQISALEQQVAQAQAELEEYQRLLNELPGIYEGKFRQKVRSVAQEIRHLLDERKALQEQVSRALAQPRVPEALPGAIQREAQPVSPTIAGPSSTPRPGPKSWADVRLPRFNPPTLAVPALPSLGGRRWVWMGGAGVLVVVLAAVVVAPWLGGRQVTPARRSASVGLGQQSSLPKPSVAVQLQARGGESWVLVEDLQGRRVFDAILQPGGSQSLSLGSGLRLRSGRPDLLFVSIGGAAPKPLGAVSDLDWVELRP